MADAYRRLVLRVASDAEILSAALWELGTLGLELRDDGSLVAWFESRDSYAGVDWGAHGGRLESDEAERAADWMAAYRAASRPLAIGERLVVDPREPALSAGEGDHWPGRRLLRLPARTAFGTGSHASTRLVLELIETLDLRGLRVLDVGVGSGVLSFAALAQGARRVVGVEIDVAALLVASENRRLNELHPSWVAGGVEVLRSAGGFDLALVNVLPRRIASALGRIGELLERDGTAIFSGIPLEDESEVMERLGRAGFRPRGRRSLDGWSAIVVRWSSA